MKVLVTGGLGFIGSHTVVELQNKGYEVIIIDDLSNSSIDVLEGISKITGIKPTFEKLDLRHKKNLDEFFKTYQHLDGVIHFAASKAVGESVQKPLLYYENNLSTLIYLLQYAHKGRFSNFIFSSSCTVYGQADQLPITENSPVKKAESPYGNTKQIGEEIIQDFCKVSLKVKSMSLRYFNPIGAHDSTLIGELPIGIPQNLIPFITQTAAGVRKELSIFGNDYPTRDGTCIRDYIHVVDLAKAHVVAFEQLAQKKDVKKYDTFNLGTGEGSSVLEVIKTFEKVSGKPLNYKVVGRREGDTIEIYADTSKAYRELGWRAHQSLESALASAWKWQQKLQYKSL